MNRGQPLIEGILAVMLYLRSETTMVRSLRVEHEGACFGATSSRQLAKEGLTEGSKKKDYTTRRLKVRVKKLAEQSKSQERI